MAMPTRAPSTSPVCYPRRTIRRSATRDFRRGAELNGEHPARLETRCLLLRHHLDRPALLRAFALVLVEDFFAEPKIFRRRFHVFVRADVFQCAFEGQLQRRVELDAFAVALPTPVG